MLNAMARTKSILQTDWISYFTEPLKNLGRQNYLHRASRNLMQSAVHYANKKTEHYHLSWTPFSTPADNSKFSYDIIEVPFDVQCIIQTPGTEMNPCVVLGKWFLESKKGHNETYSCEINSSQSTFMLRKKHMELCFQKEENDTFNPDSFTILESRLSGKPGSLFAQHFPLGIDITEFAEYVFRPTTPEKLESVSVQLYELLPFILHNVASTFNKPLTYYEKETLYVSILLDDTYDVYNIQYNDCIFPFSLTNLTQE